MHIHLCTTIGAPVEHVWATVEDIATHTRWMADAESIEFVDRAAPRRRDRVRLPDARRTVHHRRPHARHRMGAGRGDGHRAPRAS